ncbi:MAG: hypothetical protein IM577_06125 [Chitinophagaceae bacterium]|nr:hypothetical protein [Chitinophagaceae bacterium]
MPFTSIDDLVSEVSNGKLSRIDWNKITGGAAYTAGRWYDTSPLAGTPVANAWAGTALNWVTCTESTGNGTQIFGLPHGGNVTPDTKHVLNGSAITAVATGVPAQLMLVDMQGYYPGISMNVATAQTLIGTPTLRYASGAGVRVYLAITATSGATAHNLSMSYTNQAGTAGRAMPVTVSCTASAIVPHITHSGTAANNYGPFLPLANGDTGIQSVQTVTLSAASGAGTAALVLARPLLTIPLTTAAVASERDFLNQLPSLPRVQDGACLVWLYFAGAATGASSNFYGSLELGWG